MLVRQGSSSQLVVHEPMLGLPQYYLAKSIEERRAGKERLISILRLIESTIGLSRTSQHRFISFVILFIGKDTQIFWDGFLAPQDIRKIPAELVLIFTRSTGLL